MSENEIGFVSKNNWVPCHSGRALKFSAVARQSICRPKPLDVKILFHLLQVHEWKVTAQKPGGKVRKSRFAGCHKVLSRHCDKQHFRMFLSNHHLANDGTFGTLKFCFAPLICLLMPRELKLLFAFKNLPQQHPTQLTNQNQNHSGKKCCRFRPVFRTLLQAERRQFVLVGDVARHQVASDGRSCLVNGQWSHAARRRIFGACGGEPE